MAAPFFGKGGLDAKAYVADHRVCGKLCSVLLLFVKQLDLWLYGALPDFCGIVCFGKTIPGWSCLSWFAGGLLPVFAL